MIKLLDGVKEEMLKTEYWTADHDPIMDRASIEKFNRKIVSDDTYRRFSLRTGELPTDEKRKEFVLYNLRYSQNMPMSAELEDRIKRGLDRFGSEFKYGICVKRDAMMSLPISGTWAQRKAFTLSPVHMNEGVIVYSETEDGKWLFVRSETYYGWVKKDSIALCHSRSEMLEYLNFREFLVVTGESLYIPFGGSDNAVIKYDLGDRIEIIGEDTDNYYITIFGSEEDGYAAKRKAAVSKKSRVHKGYLDFSRANLISECFECLGAGYKWGGGEGQRDCSSTVMEIFSAFGICLPRSSVWQSKIPFRSYDLSGLDIEGKCAILDSLSAGALVFSERHAMIYLGKRGSDHFIFHNAGNFCRKNDQSEIYDYGTTISSLERTYSSAKGCWLNLLKTLLVPGNDFLN